MADAAAHTLFLQNPANVSSIWKFSCEEWSLVAEDQKSMEQWRLCVLRGVNRYRQSLNIAPYGHMSYAMVNATLSAIHGLDGHPARMQSLMLGSKMIVARFFQNLSLELFEQAANSTTAIIPVGARRACVSLELTSCYRLMTGVNLPENQHYDFLNNLIDALLRFGRSQQAMNNSRAGARARRTVAFHREIAAIVHERFWELVYDAVHEYIQAGGREELAVVLQRHLNQSEDMREAKRSTFWATQLAHRTLLDLAVLRIANPTNVQSSAFRTRHRMPQT